MTKKRKKKSNEQATKPEKAADPNAEGQEGERQEVVLPNVLPGDLDAMIKGKLRLFEKIRNRKMAKWLAAYSLTGQIMKASELSGVDFQKSLPLEKNRS